MSKNRVIGVALGIAALFLILLYALTNTLLLNMNINYVGIIIALVLIMNAILVLILVPKEQKNLFVTRPIGYGLTINPRNLMGLFIYTLLIVLMYLITA